MFVGRLLWQSLQQNNFTFPGNFSLQMYFHVEVCCKGAFDVLASLAWVAYRKLIPSPYADFTENKPFGSKC
jgi:hypothetical protein